MKNFRMALFAIALSLLVGLHAFNGANTTNVVSNTIGQSAYTQTTTVPLAYRVVIGILLIVVIVILVWKALKYLLGVIFIIIILLIIASTAYYIFKTGTVSIAYSMQFLSTAASGIARYLPIPYLNSSILSNLTTIYSNTTTARPYISTEQAMLLLDTQNISNSSLQVYSNYSSRSALFGNTIPASSFMYAWRVTYSWKNRNISETVLLSNNTTASGLLYNNFSRKIMNFSGAFTGVANNMQYTCYPGNTTLPIVAIAGLKNRYVALIVAQNIPANYSEISAIASNDLG